jgi:quercetin dioxygenase-like cupin family protein
MEEQKRRFDMQCKLTWLVLLGATIAIFAGSALATPSQGFTGTTLATGPLNSIDIASFFMNNDKLWFSMLKTKGKSDAYVLDNVWQPGGYTGWHTHPAWTLIIVKSGAITQYEADDPSCTPHVYTAGMVFVDPGGNHVHNVRNEGDVPAEVLAVRLVPSGQKGLIDAPAPGNCPF